MNKKRIILIIVISALAVATVIGKTPTPQPVSIKTIFNFTTSAIAGFSRVEVTDLGLVKASDKLDNETLYCKFDQNSHYISDTFYVYVQSFSLSKLEISLTAPNVMTSVDGKTVAYSFTDPAGWNLVGSNMVFIQSDTEQPTGARLALCKPIQIKVASDKVLYNTTYSMDITLGVKAI